jgi:hypothetical protein
MKRSLVLILALLLIFTLVSCGKGEGAPDGMQLAYADADAHYKFFVPGGWVLSNTGDIRSAYAGRVDTSSVSFAEVKIKGSFADDVSRDAYFFTSYFESSLSEFPKMPEITVNGESTSFGKKDFEADKAVKYIFNHEYASHKFKTMQVLLKKADRYFIFTYTALDEEKSEGETYYSFHLTEAQKCIEEFMFINVDALAGEEISYQNDGDGYLLYSDCELAGFDLYVHPDFKFDYASAIVSATHGDGSNITMTRATAAGVTVDKYWENRIKELSEIVTDITVIRENAECAFGNAKNKFSYEYTFSYNGNQYHVYQVLAVYGSDGYVFTYTARTENYEAHIEQINKTIDKVVLK